MGHAGGHDDHELAACGSGEEGANGERGFGLAHEDAGSDVGALGTAGSHGALHDPGDDLDDLLHEADVVEHGEEGGDEDDGGKDGEGEDGERIAGSSEGAEDQRGAVDGVGKQAGDDGGDFVKDSLSGVPLDDEEGEEDLQAEAPDDGAELDGAAIGGEGVGEGEEGDES